MTSTGTASAVRPSGARVFSRGLSEGVLGGLFGMGLFFMGIGLVVTALTTAERLPLMWPPTSGASGAVVALLTRHRRWMLSTGPGHGGWRGPLGPAATRPWSVTDVFSA